MVSFNMNNPSLLRENIDEDYKIKLENEIIEYSRQISEIEEKIKQIKIELEKSYEKLKEFKQKKNQIDQNIQKIHTLKNRIEIQQAKLVQIESKNIDLNQIKNELSKNIGTEFRNKVKYYSKLECLVGLTIL